MQSKEEKEEGQLQQQMALQETLAFARRRLAQISDLLTSSPHGDGGADSDDDAKEGGGGAEGVVDQFANKSKRLALWAIRNNGDGANGAPQPPPSMDAPPTITTTCPDGGNSSAAVPAADTDTTAEIGVTTKKKTTKKEAAEALLRREVRAHGAAVDLLRLMLLRDPSHRITAAEALRHPFFTA